MQLINEYYKELALCSTYLKACKWVTTAYSNPYTNYLGRYEYEITPKEFRYGQDNTNLKKIIHTQFTHINLTYEAIRSAAKGLVSEPTTALPSIASLWVCPMTTMASTTVKKEGTPSAAVMRCLATVVANNIFVQTAISSMHMVTAARSNSTSRWMTLMTTMLRVWHPLAVSPDASATGAVQPHAMEAVIFSSSHKNDMATTGRSGSAA